MSTKPLSCLVKMHAFLPKTENDRQDSIVIAGVEVRGSDLVAAANREADALPETQSSDDQAPRNGRSVSLRPADRPE